MSKTESRQVNLKELPRDSLLCQGQYVILKSLGDGGFGITYLALHQLLENKRVAIKEYMPAERASRGQNSVVHVLSERHRDDFEYGLEKFFEEANNLHRITQLQNPALVNIVNVETVFRENGTAYMVMEYVDGSSLLDTICELKKTGKKLPEDRILAIFEHLAKAIHFIHGQNLLHRDITPTNIIVRRKDNLPVLIDFGSARNQTTLDIARGTTGTRIMFTRGYAPLEQCITGKQQDQRADIYGLAATMYHLTLRKIPPESLTRGLIDEDEEDPLEPAVRAGAKDGYSQELLETLDRGLRLRAHDRPDSIAEWVAPLGFAMDKEPEPPLPPLDPPSDPGIVAKVLNWLNQGWRRTFAAAAGITIVAILLFFLIPDSSDQRLNLAEKLLVAAPFDESNLDSANDHYARVRRISDSGTDMYKRATAGGDVVDELRSFHANVTARNLSGAHRDHEELERHTVTAGLHESVMEQINSVLLFESRLNDISELLDETNLEQSLEAESDKLQTLLSTATNKLQTFSSIETEETRVVAAKNALDAVVRAGKNMRASQFAAADDDIGEAQIFAAQIGYGPTDIANAKPAIEQMRGIYVYELLAQAVEGLVDATDPTTLSTTRDAYENILRVDSSSKQATAGLNLCDRLETILNRIANGDVSSVEAELQNVALVAVDAGIKEQRLISLQTSFRTLSVSKRLEIAAQTLAANALTAQIHAQANEHYGAVIKDTANYGLDSGYIVRARMGQVGVRSLQSILSAVNARTYAEAENRLGASAGILQIITGDREIVDSAARAISSALRSDVESRMQTVLDTINAYRLPSDTGSVRDAVATVFAISKDEPRALATDSVADNLDDLLRSVSAGNYADAHDRWQTATKTLESLDVERDFTAINRSWLDSETFAAGERQLEDAYKRLEITPLNAETIETTRRVVKGTIEMSQLASHENENAIILSDVLTTLERIRAALEDSDFITLRQQATDAVSAIEKSELEVISLQSTLLNLIVVQENDVTDKVHSQVQAILNEGYDVVSADPLSANRIAELLGKLAGFDENRKNFTNQGIEYDWTRVDEAKSVYAGLAFSIEQARNKTDYVGATQSLVKLDLRLTQDSRWKEVIKRALTAIQSEWLQRIGTLLVDAGNALETEPLSAEALDKASQIYQQIQELEQSTDGRGGNGQQFITVLRPYARAVTESDLAFLLRNAHKLLPDTEPFVTLPGVTTTVTNLDSHISDKVALKFKDSRNQINAALNELTAQPSDTELAELTSKLDSLHENFVADGLVAPAEFASKTRATVQFLVDAQRLHDTRYHYAASNKLDEFKSSPELNSVLPEARSKLDAAALALENKIEDVVRPDVPRFTLMLIRVFQPLGANPFDRDVWSQIDKVVREILDKQPDFPNAVLVSEISQALSGSIRGQSINPADCTRIGAALSAKNEARNVFFDTTPLDTLYTSSCAN